MTTNDRPRRGPGRPAKSEAGDTKAALVDAALRLFAQNGFAGTSIRAIAREVGLSESALYAHFPSKKAIHEAAMRVAGPLVAVVALEETPAGAGPAEFIRAFTDRVVTAWDTPRARQAIGLAVRDGLIHDDGLKEGIDGALRGLAGVFARWIEEGRIRDDLGSPEDLAYALLAPIAHARLMGLHGEATAGQRGDARRRMTAHAELFARAVTVPPSGGDR
ncbi:TetR/AcrR family transcriptional regulator [Actinomadura sp. NTSP31]|uniref:TetR/AcrR family transcriptional regulator n=1 Tax=Actinomadura sp. NTSP31 TaxID=1735447 RepID=UPI0035C06AA5